MTHMFKQTKKPMTMFLPKYEEKMLSQSKNFPERRHGALKRDALTPTSWRKPAPVTRAQHAGTPRQMQDRRAAVSKARGESALHTEPRVSEEDLGADGLCPHLGRGQQAHCTSAELL